MSRILRRATIRARWVVVAAVAAVAALAIAPGAQPQSTPAPGSTWTSVPDVGTSTATVDWDSVWPRDHYLAYLYDGRGVQLRRTQANGPIGNTSSHQWTQLDACTDYQGAGSAVVGGVETALSPRASFRTTGCWGGYSNPWHLPPAGWRPYTDTAAWNRGTAGASARPDSAVLVDYLRQTANGRMQNIAVPDDTGSAPVYFADADDPLYTISCRQWVATCEVHGKTVRIPRRARPTPEYDRHLVSIQPDGTEVDLWKSDDPSGTGGTLSVAHGGMTRIDGDSTGSNAVAAATGALAGQFSSRSWRADRIDHALQLIIPHDSGSYVYPAGKTGDSDPAASPVPMGQWFKLDVTDAQLALEPPWRRALYRAMRDYGLFVVDTGASFMIAHENPLTFTAFGAADPAWGWLSGQSGVDEWVDPSTGKLNMVAKTPDFPFDELVALRPPAGQ